MKKVLTLLFAHTVSFSMVAQVKIEDWNKKNIVRFNAGMVSLDDGNIIAPIFDFQYQQMIAKKIGVGAKMSFASGGANRSSFDFDDGTKRFVTQNSLGNSKNIRNGLISLEESTHEGTQLDLNLITSYALVQKPRTTLSVYGGIGAGLITVQDVQQIYKADVTFIGSTKAERVIIYVPNYTKIFDITFPVGVNYNYYMRKNMFIGCELGATFYSQYTWYGYGSLSVGFRFD